MLCMLCYVYPTEIIQSLQVKLDGFFVETINMFTGSTHSAKAITTLQFDST